MLTAATPSLAAAPKGGEKLPSTTSPLPSKVAPDLKVVVTPHRAVRLGEMKWEKAGMEEYGRGA